jgi:hypothetical protein
MFLLIPAVCSSDPDRGLIILINISRLSFSPNRLLEHKTQLIPPTCLRIINKIHGATSHRLLRKLRRRYTFLHRIESETSHLQLCER